MSFLYKNPIGGEGFLRAMPAAQALRFPGAGDFGFAKTLFEKQNITHLAPCQEILMDYAEEIRAARTEREILLYVPVNAPFSLRGNYGGYRARTFDLSTGKEIPAELTCGDGTAHVEMHSGYEDALILLEKR